MKKKYEIEIRGCDDSNYFELELTDEQLELLQQIAALSIANSEYSCQPRVFIEEAK